MSLEQLGNNVTREYLEDGQIIVYTVIGGGQAITDSWANAMIAELTAWDIQRPYLSLQDMSRSGISPYGKKRTADIVGSIPPGTHVYIAIVVGDTIFGRFIKLLVQSASQARKETPFEYRFFTTREAGLAWLMAYLDIQAG